MRPAVAEAAPRVLDRADKRGPDRLIGLDADTDQPLAIPFAEDSQRLAILPPRVQVGHSQQKPGCQLNIFLNKAKWGRGFSTPIHWLPFTIIGRTEKNPVARTMA